MEAAKEAFPDWSARSPQQRAEVLNKLADLIDDNLEEFARAESRDQGVLRCSVGCIRARKFNRTQNESSVFPDRMAHNDMHIVHRAKVRNLNKKNLN